MRAALLVLTLAVAAGAVCADTWEARRAELGSPEQPYRILVDKVLMFANAWVMTPDHVAEIREAGFNVVVPRIGADDNTRVERVAKMARDQGVFYMPWIRGTVVEKGDPALRLTDAAGRYGELAGPNAEALWAYWRDRILFYAQLSREVPSVLGVFMDFENYDSSRVGGGMCYELSYDEPTLTAFAKAEGLALPDPLPADRAAWLEAMGATAAFEQFQVEIWRTRARQLREEIDAINPLFQFVVYPARSSLFIREAVWREWHTTQAPLVMADVDTYWRREYELEAALEHIRTVIEAARAEIDKVDPTIRYMAGIDPVVSGANPEFVGKSAVLGAEFGNGYWVFYEGPEYEGTHRDHFTWFRRANDDILQQDYSLWRRPAETPNPIDEQIAQTARMVAGARLAPFSTEPLSPDALEVCFTHRPRATYQVLLKRGERLQGQLVAIKHAHITDSSVAVVVAPSGEMLASVRATIEEPAGIDVLAPEDGVYGIAVTCGRGKGQLRLANRYLCLAGPNLTLVGNQPPAYLAPRPGAADIALKVAGQGPGEHLQVTLKAPDGAVAFSGNSLEGEDHTTLQIRADLAEQRAPWSLELTAVVEDIAIDLHGCEPRLATHPGRLLVTHQ